MKCSLCKGQMKNGKTNMPFEIDQDSVIVVKDVPALLCSQCGESFIEIDTVRLIEKIVKVAEQTGVTLGFVQYKEAA